MKTISTCASRTMRSEAHHVFGSAGQVTYTVCALRAQADGAEISVQLCAECEGERETASLVITADQYLTLKPSRGVISEEAYEQLREASELCSAIRAGESLLSFRSNSVQMLTHKLTERGYARATAAAAAKVLAERGMIDEAADLRREVERSLAKLWGPKRIQAHLWSRGFGKEALDLLPGILERIDFVKVCAALIRKHYVHLPEDANERRRMIAFLSRYGYSIGVIREALSAVFSAREDG